MKKLFPWMILLAIGCGFLTGRLEEVNKSVLTGTSQAIQLLIGLMGGICFWNGIMTIAKDAGLTKKLANLFSPLLRLLFHGINKGDQVSIFEHRDVTEGRVIGESIRLYVMFVSYVVEYGSIHEYYRKVEL